VARIHALMSFHEADSDISVLNRDGARQAVIVAPETYDVIRRGLEIAKVSKGVFDFTVGADLAAWGFLPRPGNAPEPDPRASWRDIELLDGQNVRFHRPLWIDLGGIAKGYAVDCAVAKVTALGAPQVCINAGGDLRVKGPQAERVLLRTGLAGDSVPVVEIENGSLASSGGREHLKRHDGRLVGPHLHGARRTPVGTRSFVSVVAEDCIIADALTKVALARGREAAPLLRTFGATGYLHNARHGWRVIGRESA
ncbi:MAG: FAD:protein FMN transferase, partial [Rhodospirillaceae bacterium]|nr:FAD:protein FMN transferase [Rhodospirillaceae bacterium]